jgi:hypothetical protein
MYKAFLVREVTGFSESKKVFYSRDVKFDITVFPYQNVPVPRPVSFPVDDLVTTSSIVGDADELADATTSDISIDLDVDATNQQDELDEKHGTDGEDSCSLEELDLLENCSESSFSDEIPDLYGGNLFLFEDNFIFKSKH